MLAPQPGQVGRLPAPLPLLLALPGRPEEWRNGFFPLRGLLGLPPDKEAVEELRATSVADGERGARPQTDLPVSLPKMTTCFGLAVGALGSSEGEAPCGLGCHWTRRVSY